MTDAEDVDCVALDSKKYAARVRLVAIKQLPHFEATEAFSGANPHRRGKSSRDAMASRSLKNHRKPVSPACCDSSHSRITSASCSACGVISTRKAMLRAQLLKELGGGPGASGLYLFIGLPHGVHGFRRSRVVPNPDMRPRRRPALRRGPARDVARILPVAPCVLA
jgi:hypothetical protein